MIGWIAIPSSFFRLLQIAVACGDQEKRREVIVHH